MDRRKGVTPSRLVQRSSSLDSQAAHPAGGGIRVGLLICCLLINGCQYGPRQTQDPQSSVVRLRGELIALAKGESDEIIGKTGQQEAYILMYGYEGKLDSLGVSETLRRKLEGIAPRPTEMYVLAHVKNDDVTEYTEWELSAENYHALLWPTPFMFRGDPFKVTAKERAPFQVVMKTE